MALCQVSPKATPGCMNVRAPTARTIMAPSRIMKVISSLASSPSNPSWSSATRKVDRTKMRMVAARRARWRERRRLG